MVKQKPLINIRNVDAGYQDETVLEDVSFSVMELDFIGIIGPNGGGKTTLIKVLLGLLKPMKGSVEYAIRKSDIGYLPQGIHVDEKFPISVREVVLSGMPYSIGLQIRRSPGKDLRLQEVLAKVGIETIQDKAIGELSGGELQRTMLARALASSPRLLVLDEPDTHVDNRFEMELYGLLRILNESITILLVSHDIGIVSPYIKSIACVNRDLHYHPSNEISEEQLKVYNCPIEVMTHGTVPHRVVKSHNHS